MLKLLIVDDEPKARRVVSTYVSELELNTKIVAQVSNIPDAVKAINKHKPDLILLDIEMPQQNGFALFEYFDEISFQVIFVTASPDYAIEAFKVAALDYILKPVDKLQLKSALERAINSPISTVKEQISVYKNTKEKKIPERFALATANQIEFVSVDDILYLKADGAYTEFHLTSGNKVIVSKPIKEYSSLESHPLFFKTHRSFVINLSEVLRFHKEEGGSIELKNGDKVGLSRHRKQEFLNAMGRLS